VLLPDKLSIPEHAANDDTMSSTPSIEAKEAQGHMQTLKLQPG
jgi:hypothetical protein